MKRARPDKEVSYMSIATLNQLNYLKNHPEILDDYLDFVHEQAGVSQARMMQRLRMTWGGRPPTALMITSASEYFATGRHRGCVITKASGRTFIAPPAEMAKLQDTILTLDCLPWVTGAKLLKGLFGWRVTICLLGPPPESENLDYEETSQFWDAFWAKEEFKRLLDEYILTTGEKAPVSTAWSQSDSLLLEVREETEDEMHDDWEFYLHRALVFVDYAFRRGNAKYVNPGFMADKLTELHHLLKKHQVNPFHPWEDSWNSATQYLVPYLFYFEKDLSPKLKQDFFAIMDSLAAEGAPLRTSYWQDQAYCSSQNIDKLDGGRRQQYFYLGRQAELRLRTMACNHAEELLKLEEKARAELPAIPAGTEWQYRMADRRYVGLDTQRIDYASQITPLSLKELRVVLEAYESPDHLGVLDILEEMAEGKGPDHAMPHSEHGSQVYFSFQTLVLFGCTFKIDMPTGIDTDWAEATFSFGKHEIDLSVKCEESTAEEYSLYAEGKASGNLGVEFNMHESLNSLGALMWHLRRKGKLPPVEQAAR